MAKQYAVLVGLKEVDPDAYHGWDGKGGCYGCELDVDNVGRILEDLNYNITVLKTEEATRSNILKKLKSVSKKLESGDTFVFYYSGHGGQTPDLNNDEEGDGQDETLVAYDGEIVDDSLNEIWTKLKKGVRVVMLSDSCNSGTNYRNLGTVHRATPMNPVSKSVQGSMNAQMIHMGGCRDGFVSMGYMSGGAFTMALCSVWANGEFTGSYRDFYNRIRAEVSGQQIQYNKYGPVSANFENEKPFSGSPSTPDSQSANLINPSEPRAFSGSGGQLVGPRMSGGRNRSGPRAGGVLMNQSGVNSIVHSRLGSKLSSNSLIRYGDGTYYLPTMAEVQSLLSASQSDRRTWTEERFDCDDFAYVLKGEAAAHSYASADFQFGMCLGMIWANFSWLNGFHAANWFVASNRELYLIEPQNDQIYSYADCKDSISLLIV